MADEYSSSREPDEDIQEAQLASRKRRKLLNDGSSSEAESAPTRAPKLSLPSLSRVKPAAKSRDAVQRTSGAAPIIESRSKGNVSFATIDVAPWLVTSLSSMEIKRPTGIQKACIPEILKGRDCIGGSRTGTGKTVAFSVPILQKWAEDPCGIFALIIT